MTPNHPHRALRVHEQWESALFLLGKIGTKSSRPQTWIAEVAGSIRDVAGSLTQTLTARFVGEHACSLGSTGAVQFHNWPKLTYSWAPAKRQLSPSADSCAPLAVGSAVPGADWSRCNPPLLFFSLLVGLIFSWLSLLNWPTAWVDTGAGTRRRPGVPSWKVQVWPFCHQHGLGHQESEGSAPQLCRACKPPQMPWEGRAGHCLRMGCKHSSAPLNTEKRGLKTIC